MNNIYIKGLGIYIGAFDEDELKKGVDKEVLKKYQEEYPEYKYVNTKIVKINGIRKLAIYICNVNDFKI